MAEQSSWFLLVSILVTLCKCGSLAALGYVVSQHEGRKDLFKSGFLVPSQWPKLRRDIAGLVIVVVFVVPLTITVASIIVGEILGWVEDWAVGVGYAYIVGNIVGLVNPITNVVPESGLGIFWDIISSLFMLIVGSTLLGLASLAPMMNMFANHIQKSSLGLMLCYIPGLALITALVTGGVVSAIEGWTVGDGFLFMIGSLCGLGNPLTQVNPKTPAGMYIAVLASTVTISFGGAVVSIVGGHPLTEKVFGYIQGPADDVPNGKSSHTSFHVPGAPVAARLPKLFSGKQDLTSMNGLNSPKVRGPTRSAHTRHNSSVEKGDCAVKVSAPPDIDVEQVEQGLSQLIPQSTFDLRGATDLRMAEALRHEVAELKKQLQKKEEALQTQCRESEKIMRQKEEELKLARADFIAKEEDHQKQIRAKDDELQHAHALLEVELKRLLSPTVLQNSPARALEASAVHTIANLINTSNYSSVDGARELDSQREEDDCDDGMKKPGKTRNSQSNRSKKSGNRGSSRQASRRPSCASISSAISEDATLS